MRFGLANQERDGLYPFMRWFPVYGQSNAVIGYWKV